VQVFVGEAETALERSFFAHLGQNLVYLDQQVQQVQEAVVGRVRMRQQGRVDRRRPVGDFLVEALAVRVCRREPRRRTQQALHEALPVRRPAQLREHVAHAVRQRVELASVFADLVDRQRLWLIAGDSLDLLIDLLKRRARTRILPLFLFAFFERGFERVSESFEVLDGSEEVFHVLAGVLNLFCSGGCGFGRGLGRLD